MPASPAVRTVTTAMAAMLVRRSRGTIYAWVSRGYLARLDSGQLDLDAVYRCERERRRHDRNGNARRCVDNHRAGNAR